MGIPSYFKYIIKNYNIIFKKRTQIKTIEHLYIDSNSIIYDCLRTLNIVNYTNNAEFEQDLIEAVFIKISEYTDIVEPKKSLFVAIDGVVPYAKMEQQRQRRYKSSLLKSVENDIQNEVRNMVEGVGETEKTFSWDQTSITPGTKFMDKLDIFLNRHLKLFSQEKDIIVKFSGSNEEGEGEHKLFGHMRNNDHKDDIVCVYGLDADLIMLSLNNLNHTKNIFLMREKPNFSDELDEIYSECELMFMNIKNLFFTVLERMMNGNIKDLNKQTQINKINDYIFISFFLGNDFMPHFPALNIRIDGIDTIFNYYNKCFDTSKTIINGGKIKWKCLREFIKLLAVDERELLISNTKKQCNNYRGKHKHTIINKEEIKEGDIKRLIEDKVYQFNLTPTKERSKEKYINPSGKFWKQRYYETLFNFDFQPNNIKEVCNNYIEGLEWCFEYYTNGCKNTRWKYNFSYPPLLEDLYKHIPVFDTEMIERKQFSDVNPIVLLSYVIPKNAFHLLPNNVSAKLIDKYYYNYDDCHIVDLAYCKYFWEGHVEFPYINFEEFKDVVTLSNIE